MNTDKIYKACGMALIAALCAGCTDDASLDDGVGGSQGGAYITLTVPSGITPATRTVLPGSQNVQHATRVALYAFKHDDRETDTLKARCIGGMSFDKVNWNQDLDKAMDGGTSTKTQRVKLPDEWNISESNSENWNATYTFLAIGSDDVYKNGEKGTWAGSNSTAAYGLGADDYFSKDETLGDCYAELQDNKSVDDIHQSELFAGTLTCKGSEVAGKEINLYRRVAGVKGYFRRIPETAGGGTVNELRVVYFNSQATSVPYFKRWPQDGIFSDYDKREDSPLYGVSGSIIPDDGSPISKAKLDKCTYFTISKDPSSGEFVSQDGTAEADDKENEYDYVTAGSYVLPAPGAVGKSSDGKDYSTLYVLLLAKADEEGKMKILQKRRVFFVNSYENRTAQTRSDGVTDGGTDGGTGIIIGQEPNEDALDRERRYPIVANNYYTIGTAQEPIDMSTGETEVNIYVDPRWEGNNDLEWIN